MAFRTMFSPTYNINAPFKERNKILLGKHSPILFDERFQFCKELLDLIKHPASAATYTLSLLLNSNERYSGQNGLQFLISIELIQ